MTNTVAPAVVVGRAAEVTPNTVAQTLALARRSVIGTARQPAAWVPGFLFPLLMAAVNASAMGQAINLPGFGPAESFLQFLLPATLIQGVMFGGIVGGTDMAVDIENGFFERLVASPVSRPAILVGRLAGAGVMGAVQATVFIAVFRLFGATVMGGVPAMVVLVLVGIVLAIAIGGACAAIALRTGSQEAVQSSFPLIFVLLFISSAFFPTALMSGWYKTVAQNNPITWMIDAARDLCTVGFELRDAVVAVGIAAAFALLTIFLATRQFQRRLRVAA